MLDFNHEFGRQLKLARIKKKVPQVYISYILDITRQEYRQVEAGKKDISLSQLIDVAKYLSVPVVISFDRKDERSKAAYIPELEALKSQLSDKTNRIAEMEALLELKNKEIAVLQAKLIKYYYQADAEK